MPFSRELCTHIGEIDTQSTSAGGRFLDACRHFNAGTITYDELCYHDRAARLGGQLGRDVAAEHDRQVEVHGVRVFGLTVESDGIGFVGPHARKRFGAFRIDNGPVHVEISWYEDGSDVKRSQRYDLG